MDDLTRLILEKTDALDQFREQMTVFESSLWASIIDIFNQAEKGLVDNMLESDNGKVDSIRECIRMLRRFKQMPDILGEAIRGQEADVDELEKERILNNAEEGAFRQGDL